MEAQRLGLEAHASDLNPVAVLINKAMIEIPPKFAGMPPVNPEARVQMAEDRELGMEREWKGAQGLAEDVRYYGKWMRDEAEKRIGHLYPKVEVTPAMASERPDLERYVGRKLTVIAWLWARTVKSPNPAFRDVDVPLATTFVLSKREGRQAYVHPVIEDGLHPKLHAARRDARQAYVHPVIEDGCYSFSVRAGTPPEEARRGTSQGPRQAFRCLMSGTPVTYDHIRAEGMAGHMGARMLAIVAEGDGGRLYLPPTPDHESASAQATPEWRPDCELPKKHRNFQGPVYGLTNVGDLFTSRQLVALTTFSDMVTKLCELAREAAIHTDHADAYAEAVATYLAFAQSKACDRNTSLCRWEHRDKLVGTFSRQALPMVWDFAETNPFAGAGGDIFGTAKSVSEVLEKQFSSPSAGVSRQRDAAHQGQSVDKVVSTDPPYYDNVAYADLSDFFYVWLRRSLVTVFPDLFATLATPKTAEAVAAPHRHSSKEDAESFFLDAMNKAIRCLVEQVHPAFPTTIYYAFKQTESRGDGAVRRTGWETFLDAVIQSGFSVSGTWPMRTELGNRMIGRDANALASSIVLVCRRRPEDAPLATRRQFIDALKAELPTALAHLQSGGIAPVDLAQAAIGPGMAVYTRYAKVVDATGEPVTVREALTLINQTLDECLSAHEGDFDADTRWALAWFEQHGFEDGDYGDAETLSKAKNTSIASLQAIGILQSKAGKVQLLIPLALHEDWDPRSAGRVSAWLTLHQLIRVHNAGGEQAAAALVRDLGGVAETARELAYRLYAIAERTKRAREALWYNALVQSWPEIARLAREDRGEQGDILAPEAAQEG